MTSHGGLTAIPCTFRNALGTQRRQRTTAATWAALGTVVVVGLLLRVAAARGDLWLDELWSLDLVSRLRWPGEVFWAVPHDNNHPLNSLWLALVGPDASPGLYRAPAVLYGTATVAAAARLGRRSGPAAGIAAAILTACAYPLVLYGSEARGYAGLILADVLAIDLWRSIMDERAAGATVVALGPRCWALAAVVLFGTASHLTMLGAVAILGGATVLRTWPQRGFAIAIDEAVTLFRPVLALLLPLGLVLVAGAFANGGFVVGGVTPFAPGRFLQGYGGLLSAWLGLRTIAPAWCALTLAGILLGAGFATRLIDRRMGPLALVSLVLLPAGLFLAHVGNTEFPRYFLVAGLILPILLAEMAGQLWATGTLGRIGAVLLVGLPCLGQIPDLVELMRAHRGSPEAALALVDPGAVVRLKGDAPFAAAFVAAHYGAAGHHGFVAPASCLPSGAIPNWLILDGGASDAVPDRITDDAPAFPIQYVHVRTFPTTRWSGRAWSVYRRDP